MPAMSVMCKGQIVNFNSDLTNAGALALLGGSTNAFAQDLVRKSGRGLSASQWAWVHKLAVDQTAPRPSSNLILAGIVALFAKAGQHKKYPKMKINTPELGEFKLSLAGPASKYCGSVRIVKGNYGEWDYVYFGSISPDGRFVPSRACTPQMVEFLTEMNDNPSAAGAKYGHMTGECCFCGLTLTDQRSITVGYGPICAQNWGLAWG